MSNMGKYCKAYPITQLRTYQGWTENTDNVRKDKKIVDGEEVEVDRQLTSEDYLFIQENYVVTDGIFLDENIIFDNVTTEWMAFCKDTLKFEIPVYETIPLQQEEEKSDATVSQG